MQSRLRASANRLRLLDVTGVVGLVLLSAILLWRDRLWLDTDTVTYADISDALLTGNWSAAVNGYFSPLWAVLIAVTRRLASVDAAHESPLVRLLQWIVAIGCVVMARRLLQELRHWTASQPTDPVLGAGTAAGTLFFWVGALLAIDRLSLSLSNPDVLLTFLALGASCEIFAIQRTQSVKRGVALGAWIAAMYWTKGIALPLGAGFCVAAALVSARAMRTRIVMAVSMTAILLSVPLVLALSLQQQRLDVGDTGRLTFGWFTAGASSLTPDPRATGVESLVHRWKREVHDPPLYSYDGGQPGTYPPWRDPVYWQAGLTIRPSVFQVASRLSAQSAEFWNFYFGATVVGIALAAAATGGLRSTAPGLSLALALPALLAVASYLPILFEPRYFAPVVQLAVASLMTLSPSGGRRWPWMVLAAAASVGWHLPTVRELLTAAPLAILLYLVSRSFDAGRRIAVTALSLALAAATVPGVIRQLPGFSREGQRDGRNDQEALARALTGAGVPEGTRISMVGMVGPGHYELWWARRARLRIVAEIPRGFEAGFWQASDSEQQRVFAAMSTAGARYVVARRPADGAGMDTSWQQLGSTGHSLRVLVR